MKSKANIWQTMYDDDDSTVDGGIAHSGGGGGGGAGVRWLTSDLAMSSSGLRMPFDAGKLELRLVDEFVGKAHHGQHDARRR